MGRKDPAPRREPIGDRDKPRWQASDFLTLKKMRYFLAVAECGKVTEAAREVLFVSPSAVAMAMRELEDYIGTSLFERHPGGMRLTHEGERFRGYCLKALSLVDDAASALRRKSPLVGHIGLVASPAVHGYFLPPLLARFRQLFPSVEVTLTEMDRGCAERALAEGGADIGVLLTSNMRDLRNLRRIRIVSSARGLWCGAQHRLADLPAVSLSDIAREPYIQLTLDETEENTRAFWARHRQAPHVSLRTNTVEAVRGHIGHGEGVAILSEMLFRPWTLEGDRLLFKPVREPIPSMEVGIALPRHAAVPPPVRALCDFLAPSPGGGSRLPVQKN